MTETCAKCGFRRTPGTSKCTRCGTKASAPHLPWDAVEPTTFGDAPLEIDAGADEEYEEPISSESVSGELMTDGEVHPDHVAAAVRRAVEAAKNASAEEAARAADIARMAAQSLARQRQSARVEQPRQQSPRRARAEFTAVSDYLDDSQLELEQSAERSEPSVALVPVPPRAMVRRPSPRTNPPPRVSPPPRTAAPRPPVRDLVAEYDNVRAEPAPRRFPTAFVAGFGCASFMFGAVGMGGFAWIAYSHSLPRPAEAATVAAAAPQATDTPVRMAATPAATPVLIAQATARPAPSPVSRIAPAAFHPAPAPIQHPKPMVAARPVATPAPRTVAMASRPTPAPRPATKAAPAASSSGSGLPWDDAPAASHSAKTQTAAASGGSGLPWEDSSPAVDPLADPPAAPKPAGISRVIHSRGGDKPVDLNKNIALTGADGTTVVGKLISVKDGFVDVKTSDSSIRIAEKDVVDAATY